MENKINTKSDNEIDNNLNGDVINNNFNNYKEAFIEYNNLKLSHSRTQDDITVIQDELLELTQKGSTIEFNNLLSLSPEELKKEINSHQKEIQSQKDLIKSYDEEYKLYYSCMTKNSVSQSDDPELKNLKDFLVQHNAEQSNALKRFFNIPKDPYKVSRKEAKKLIPIMNELYNKKVKECHNKIETSKSVSYIYEQTVKLNEKKELKNNLETKIKNKFQVVENHEAKIKKTIDLLLDMNFSELKKFIVDHNIKIKPILFFIKEHIKKLFKNNNTSSLKGTQQNSIQKYKKLEGDLDKIKIPKKHQLSK